MLKDMVCIKVIVRYRKWCYRLFINYCSDIGSDVIDEMVSCFWSGGLGLMLRDFM